MSLDMIQSFVRRATGPLNQKLAQMMAPVAAEPSASKSPAQDQAQLQKNPEARYGAYANNAPSSGIRQLRIVNPATRKITVIRLQRPLSQQAFAELQNRLKQNQSLSSIVRFLRDQQSNNPSPVTPPRPPIAPKPPETSQDPVTPQPPVTPQDPVAPQPPATGGEATRQAKIDRVRQNLSPQAQTAFQQLESKLDETDLKEGKTLLDHLDALAKDGVNPRLEQQGISTKTILSELVQTLAEPGSIHQSNRNSCAATTVEYYMAFNHPAEFARLAGGIVSQGQVAAASGNTLALDPGSVPKDSSSRSNLDRMIQTTLMDQSSLGDYSNQTDRRRNGSSGMTQQDVTNLMNNLTAGTDGRFQTRDASNTSDLVGKIAQSTQKGIEVPVGIRWNSSGLQHSYHELLVTKIENGMVHLRNPWGEEENGRMFNGPNRQLINDQGGIALTIAEFQNRLVQASLA